jgi:hypothetical protein
MSTGNRRSLSRARHDVTDPCVPVEAIVADLLDAYQTGDPVARNLTLADANVLEPPTTPEQSSSPCANSYSTSSGNESATMTLSWFVATSTPWLAPRAQPRSRHRGQMPSPDRRRRSAVALPSTGRGANGSTQRQASVR